MKVIKTIMGMFLVFLYVKNTIYCCSGEIRGACLSKTNYLAKAYGDVKEYSTALSGAAGISQFGYMRILYPILDNQTIVVDTTNKEIWQGGLKWVGAMTNYPATGGCSWPEFQEAPDIAIGDALFIGNVFHFAYMATGLAHYLDFSNGSRDYTISKAVPGFPAGYVWPTMEGGNTCLSSHDHNGTACMGYNFLARYKLFGDTLSQEYAKGAAEWLKATAREVQECNGYKWHNMWGLNGGFDKFYTGWCRGPGFIIEFLYNMYETFGDESYKDYATGALNWLKDMAIPENGGYKWPQWEGSNQYHTTHGQGAAGIGRVFLKAYKKSNDPSYLEYAKGAAEWLKSQAKPIGQGYMWPMWVSQNDTGTIQGTVCQGIFGVSWFFADLYKATGDTSYLKYALGSSNTIDSIKIDDGRGGISWVHSSGWTATTDAFRRALSIMVMEYVGKICSHNKSFELAEKARIYLTRQKIMEFGGYKWPFYIPTSPPVEVSYKMDPKKTVLLKSYPNPFSNMILFSLEDVGLLYDIREFELSIYDIRGRLVWSRLFASHHSPLSCKPHACFWDGRDNFGREVSTGRYYLFLNTETMSAKNPLILNKIK